MFDALATQNSLTYEQIGNMTLVQITNYVNQGKPPAKRPSERNPVMNKAERTALILAARAAYCKEHGIVNPHS